ncbi:tryptophanyl-tRNA synthetase [Rhizoctonia solani AG-1 IA]|uniref:tryptophan--tRNA ligase n=1 Tax=Thanatephorus cucumeris (strain AG1-IA) TaxID=983506 RepID=L8X0Q8_THACA|nr:tryptophanyl-tRNA synthetase [Rhizoctonia solani AG-1 IA]
MQAQLRIATNLARTTRVQALPHHSPYVLNSVHEALRYTSSGQHKPPKTIFSGIQPTGIPHVSTAVNSCRTTPVRPNPPTPADRLFFSIVGLHALTLPQDPVKLRQERLDTLAILLAIGLDPRRSVIFCQDQVSLTFGRTLAWMLNCTTPMGKLQRMTTWKSKIAIARNANSTDEVDESHLNLGLFAYPVLQAADILLYRATHVPVGEDQQQHLELSRDLADLFNRTHKERVFPLPQHIISKSRLVMSLRRSTFWSVRPKELANPNYKTLCYRGGLAYDYVPTKPHAPAKRILSLRDPSQKMSKSAPHPASRILLTDPPEAIDKKIKSAVTDSERGVEYDPVARPGVANLLTILDACRGLSGENPPDQGGDTSTRLETLASELSTLSHAEFKRWVSDAVQSTLAPIRDEYTRIRADESYIRDVAEAGRMRAFEVAENTMADVREVLGVGRL